MTKEKTKIMLRLMKHILMATAISAVLWGCGEADKQLFNDADAFFAFKNTNESVVENAKDPLEIPVYLSKSMANGTVYFEIDIEGIENPAVEGVDYELLTQGGSLEFNGNYVENIVIAPIDNEERDGTKQFRIVLKQEGSTENLGLVNNMGVSTTVSIFDNDDIRSAFIGDFELRETTLEPAEYVYNVSTFEHEDADKLILNGLWGIPQNLVLQFNFDEGTIAILPEQELYGLDFRQYGIGFIDVMVKGWHWSNSSVVREPEVAGTFDIGNGTIEFSKGYLLDISKADDPELIGKSFTIMIQDYCILTKK